jgi:hypothetical protein
MALVAIEALVAVIAEGGELGAAAAELEVAGTELGVVGTELGVAGTTATAEVGSAVATEGVAGGVAAETASVVSKSTIKAFAQEALVFLGTTTVSTLSTLTKVLLAEYVFKAAMKEISALVKAPQDQLQVERIKKLSTSQQIVKEVLENWIQWINNNRTNKNSFGSLDVEGSETPRFDLFNDAVSNLTDKLNKGICPQAGVAKPSKVGIPDIERIRLVLVDVCDDLMKRAKKIDENENLMTKAGLETHMVKIKTACELLAA